MEPPAPFPLYKLPTELVLLILGYAAEPTFSQAETYDSQNPYASALVLCRVSRFFRRAALPKLLHTVLLSPPHSLPAFVNALQMQQGYAEKKHHLQFEYAPRVHRMWISEIPRTRPSLPTFFYPPRPPAPAQPDIDFSLLAPVLLAAESLEINSARLFILLGCLRHAWNSRVVTNVDDARSPLPWSTKTFTPSYNIQWLDLQNSPEGSAFLGSITHLICLSDPTNTTMHINARYDGMGPRDYRLPNWLSRIPWASFTGLKTISVALPRIRLPLNFRYLMTGVDLQVEVLTFSASLVIGHEVPQEIRDSTETADGRILRLTQDVMDSYYMWIQACVRRTICISRYHQYLQYQDYKMTVGKQAVPRIRAVDQLSVTSQEVVGVMNMRDRIGQNKIKTIK